MRHIPTKTLFHFLFLLLIILFQSCSKEDQDVPKSDLDLFQDMEEGSIEFSAENTKYTFTTASIDAFLQKYPDQSESFFISGSTEEPSFLELSTIIIVTENGISNSKYPLEHQIGTLTYSGFNYFQMGINGGFQYSYYADPEGAIEIYDIDRSNNSITGTISGKFERVNLDGGMNKIDPPPSIVAIEGRFNKIPYEVR